ncbi:MAG TPA: hypothetical protein VKB19_08705, partial [Pedobacter sp.]|nr:hypothetical protein [Pedobacter sp.]
MSLLAMVLLAIGDIYAQNTVAQDRLQKLAIDFVRAHNSGDTAQYHHFLRSQLVPQENHKDLLRRYLNSYNAIGRVSPLHYSFASERTVKITAQENRFDSWWEFTIQTTADQVFL